MKKFKELADQIGLYESGEHTFGGGFNNINQQAHSISALSNDGIYNIQKKSQLNRINAFLDAFSRKEYMNPMGALGILRSKLNIAGLDFEFNKETCLNEEGETRFKITRFGGTFGKSLDTPFDEFETTDGISDYNDGRGFELVVNISTTANGAYKIDTQIVDEGPEVVAIEVEDEESDETDEDKK